MKTQICALGLLLMLTVGCQKELSGVKNSIPQVDNDSVANDTVYFQGKDIGLTDRNAVSGNLNLCYTDNFTVPDSVADNVKQFKFLVQKTNGVKLERVALWIDDRRKFSDLLIETRKDTFVVKLKTQQHLTPTPYSQNIHSLTMWIRGTGPVGAKFRVGFVHAEFRDTSNNILPVSTPKAWGPWSIFIR